MRGHIYLEFTVKALDMVNMWPTSNHDLGLFRWIKEYYILVILVLSTIPLIVDGIVLFYEEDFSMPNIIESFIASSALCSVIYVSICYMAKKDEIKILVNNLKIFEHFAPSSMIRATEKHIAFYTKLFIIYGIVGNFCYAIFPLITLSSCKENLYLHMHRFGIPCRVIARYLLPFRYDYSPIWEILLVEQLLVCCLGTTIIMMVTMLVCGILYHLTANLEFLRGIIEKGADMTGKKLEKHIKWCVRYHTAIIEFADRTNHCFHSMMLIHICWTSFIISILGFEIIEEGSNTNGLRFALHLFGWLGMLYIICYYGQELMDKSFGISRTIYSSTKWYEKPAKIRKYFLLILVRSQRPLSLKPAKMREMSLATFLGILSSAYSYFTLLLKIRRN